MKKIRLGLIGCGGMMKTHAQPSISAFPPATSTVRRTASTIMIWVFLFLLHFTHFGRGNAVFGLDGAGKMG